MRPVDKVKSPEVLQDFLEASNIHIVTEMVNMIEV